VVVSFFMLTQEASFGRCGIFVHGKEEKCIRRDNRELIE